MRSYNTKHYDRIARMKKGDELRIYRRDWVGKSGPRIPLQHMSVKAGGYENSKRGKQFYGKEFSVKEWNESWLILRTI